MNIPKDYDAIMAEIDALFEMTEENYEHVQAAVQEAVDSSTPVTYMELYQRANLMSAKLFGQPFEASNFTDEDGNPDGGHVEGCGLSIRWQRGPIINQPGELPWNGCFLITVLQAAQCQLEFYQSTKFACDDNKEAMARIGEAIEVLERRQRNRFTRGVRGKHDE